MPKYCINCDYYTSSCEVEEKSVAGVCGFLHGKEREKKPNDLACEKFEDKKKHQG